MTKTDTPQPLPTFGRNQIRRAMRKLYKRQEAQNQRDADKAGLDAMRASRPAHLLPKKAPGLLTMVGREYKKEHGKFNRSIIHETVKVVGGVGYEIARHATKGYRCTRMSAAALDRHLVAA